jgi:aldehyde:ferredoxin oxidoreductase
MISENFKGYAGYQLRVNLDDWEAYKEPISSQLSMDYLGGVGYAAKILYDELPENINPLDKENLIVLATGPLSISRVPGGGSIMICFKSPLTNIWGESRVGGDAGPDLKKAGFDYVIIKGKSPEPVYLVIQDGKWDFRKASHLLGLTVSLKSKIIREELGDEKASVLSIGKAGENLVKISSVMSDDRAAGRCGGGAVFGSKNLLAIAIRGSNKLETFNSKEFNQICKQSHLDIKDNPMFLGFKTSGTIGDIPGNDESGDLPTKNWLSNSWGRGEQLLSNYNYRNFIKGFGCYGGCTIACARWIHVPDGRYKTPEHGGAEYESISAFTSYVLNEDLDVAIHCTYLCNEYGLDTISTGAMIAFAMECFENGFLDPDIITGFDLSWGNAEVLPKLVKAICYREGLGDILAEGVRNAAQNNRKRISSIRHPCKRLGRSRP